MKTKAQVIRENEGLKTIINAVVSRVGMDSIEDINNHGINGGFNGFIYYNDTNAFAMRYRKIIVEMLERDAEDMGDGDGGVVAMVSNFGAFRNRKMNAEDRKDLYRYLGGGRCAQNTITNLMAWYAAETVCRLFED